MYISSFHFTPDIVDCKLCSMYDASKGCKVSVCPRLAERIKAGVVGYEEALHETFPQAVKLGTRLDTAIEHFPGSFFLDPDHRQRMEEIKTRWGYSQSEDTPALFAAVYLLSANEDLSERTARCFSHRGIAFPNATRKGISTHNYTLFSAAKDIYAGADGILLNDLADGEIVDTLAFCLIVNALLIARYGCAVLEIRERSCV